MIDSVIVEYITVVFYPFVNIIGVDNAIVVNNSKVDDTREWWKGSITNFNDTSILYIARFYDSTIVLVNFFGGKQELAIWRFWLFISSEMCNFLAGLC